MPVKFGGRADAVFTERSFILFSQVATPARASLDTGIWHLGWGGIDGPNEFKNLTARGVEFQTPVTPYANFHYMYPYGPDKEVLETSGVFVHEHQASLRSFEESRRADPRTDCAQA